MEVKDVVLTGIGRAMSDMDCQDGELSVSHNIIRDNGAMRPIWIADADSRLGLAEGERLVFVHRTSNYKNIIIRKQMVVKRTNLITLFYTIASGVIHFKVFVEYPTAKELTINISLTRDDIYTDGTVITIKKGFSGKIEKTIIGTYTYNTGFIADAEDDYYIYSYYALSDSTNTGTMETFDEIPYVYGLSYFTEEDAERKPVSASTVNYREDVKVTSVGNTIVILGDNGVEYALFKDNAYKYLGTKPPETVIRFTLQSSQIEEAYTGTTFDLDDIADMDTGNGSSYGVKEEKIEWATQMENALAAKVINNANETNRILFPCFVRYAYRLYDGSHIMHSSPILLVPSTDITPAFVFRQTYTKDDTKMMAIGSAIQVAVNPKDKEELLEWKDVITSIDFFMSEQVNPRNTDAKIDKVELLQDSDAGKSLNYGSFSDKNSDNQYGSQSFYDSAVYYYGSGTFYTLSGNKLKNEDYMKRIKETSLFYKVRSLDISEIAAGNWYLFEHENDNKGEGVNLSTLVLEERLEDDYQTHDTLIADSIFAYNSRINLSGLRRLMFGGYDTTSMVMQMYTKENVSNYYTVYTHIKKENREIVVKNTCDGVYWFSPMYLFYPDADAYKMTIINSADPVEGQYYSGYILKLESHPTLNGAVWFNVLNEAPTSLIRKLTAPETTDSLVDLKNKIYTSEVNNPFYFPLSGINTVGVGEIKGIASVTKALSQGQFGQFPLYVFSTDGVWAMEVSDTGLYSSVKPISRDVCVNGGSITQTDNNVLFVSDKGVMAIDGGTVQCISDMMNGRSLDISETGSLDMVMEKEGFSAELATVHDFMDYARDGRMVYDYTNGRIILYSEGKGMCYVFSLSGGTWATMEGGIDTSVNDYPDSYIQQGQKVVNVSQRIDYDSKAKVKTLIVTRPVKLGDDSYKTIYEMISRGAMDRRNGAVILWGSHDGLTYVPIADAMGNRLYRSGGTGYRYYRIGIVGDMNVGETVTMCSLKFRRKYNNRLR